MTRRDFLSLAGAPAAWPQTRPQRPNIIFILADDLGYGDLGCYGQKMIQTPHLDRFAAEGIRFSQAYAGSTVCAPSRCCLMTGKHTGHATVRGNRKPELSLGPEDLSVAQLLKSAGYRTALFGKWGLGGPQTGRVPTRVGFDEFFGFYDQQHAHNSYPEHLWDHEREVFLTANWFHRRKLYAPDLFMERAINFLERQSPGQPFFLYLATTIPHANNELGAVSANGMEAPDLGPYASRNWPEVEKTFAAAVTRLDSDVAKLLDVLRKRDLERNTLVIFSSDNGPHKEGHHSDRFFSSSGPLRGAKRDLYEGGIRVPALARWPGVIRPGQVSDATWAFWDFLPTAAELAGVPAPSGIDGVSVVETLISGKQAPHPYFYWEFHERGFHQAVRVGDWKLIRQGPKFEIELFDLAADPGEQRNLASQRPDIVARLEPLFRTARTDSEAFPVRRG